MLPKKLTHGLLSLLMTITISACGAFGAAQAPTQTPVASAQLPSETPAAPATPTLAPTATAVLPSPTVKPTATPAPSATLAPSLTIQPKSSPVWARNQNDKTLVKIDPASSAIQAKVNLAGGVTTMTSAPGVLWAANRTILYKLAPDDGQIIAKMALPHPAVALAVSQDSVWVGMMVEAVNPTPGVNLAPSGEIARINPDSLQIEGSVITSCQPKAIALSSTKAWVASGCFNLSLVDEIDAKSMQKNAISILPNAPKNPSLLPAAVGGNLVISNDVAWMISAGANTLDKIDLASHKITQKGDALSKYTGTPLAMAIGESQVWIVLSDGKVLGLDPASLRQTTLLDLKKSASTVDFAYSQGAVWVNDPKNAILTRIDLASMLINASISTGSSYAGPPPVPTAATAPACSITIGTQLKTGGQAQVDPKSSLPSIVRRAAGQANGVKGKLQPGEIVDLLEGPVCLDGWPWWRVRSTVTGLTGWAAEGNKNTYWLIPVK